MHAHKQQVLSLIRIDLESFKQLKTGRAASTITQSPRQPTKHTRRRHTSLTTASLTVGGDEHRGPRPDTLTVAALLGIPVLEGCGCGVVSL